MATSKMGREKTLRRSLYALLIVTMLGSLLGVIGASAAPVGNDAFQQTWARTDQPVANLQVSRTWMWGPEANTGLLTEPFDDGQRTVQYFDKSRMEITDPAGDPNSLWYVTNGLLATELVTGSLQTGPNSFESHDPATVNVSGDPTDADAPTYASFTPLLDSPPLPTGSTITETLDRAGTVGNDPSLAGAGVTAAYPVSETDHVVASVFWDLMNSSGPVYENGNTTTAPLFQSPFYATGFPISEAYWGRVLVDGVSKPVLIQVFQRRVLTYNPANPDGWKVEAGNVGQHYYTWRYSQITNPSPSPPPSASPSPSPPATPSPSASPSPSPKPALSGRIAFANRHEGAGWQVFILGSASAYSSPTRYAINVPGENTKPAWSPDGKQIAFVNDPGSGPTRILRISATKPGNLPVDVALNAAGDTTDPDWSPDGERIVFSGRQSEGGSWRLMVASATDPNAMPVEIAKNSAGDNTEPSWSPDGKRIVFANRQSNGNRQLMIVRADNPGAIPERIAVNASGDSINPAWSPDGKRVAFANRGSDGDWRLMIVRADEPNALPVEYAGSLLSDNTEPSWSPDGKRLAFANRKDDGHWRLMTVSAENPNALPKEIARNAPGPGSDNANPAWS